RDDTTTYAIGGAVGVGLADGGGAGAVNVTSITKQTLATIADHAIVEANAITSAFSVPDGTFTASGGIATKTIRGVAVLASSSEKIVSVDASVGAGTYAGIAGAVSVQLVDSDTIATITGGAQINPNTASTANPGHSVVVAATNTLSILTYAGGLAISGGVGIGASADIGILRSDTQAFIGAGASVRAKNDTDVFALSNWSVNSNAVSAGLGVGLAGLGGGI